MISVDLQLTYDQMLNEKKLWRTISVTIPTRRALYDHT